MSRQFRYSLLAVAAMTTMTAAAKASVMPTADNAVEGFSGAESIRFDPVFLNTSDSQKVDISRFERGDSALPGSWPTDIYVNGNPVAQENVLFVEQEDKRVLPCMSADILKQINLNYDNLPGVFNHALRQGQECYALEHLLPGTAVNYDSSMQRLDISVPQAMMRNTARGYVSPALWDTGIPAAILGYNASTYTTRSHGRSFTSSYAGINAGLNLGAWYFRHDGNYNWQERTGGEYQSVNNYVQRDIPAIMGRVRLGETSTSGQLFDTLPFRGIELASDDRMLPQSRRGYAPNIRGIARTNARVSIRQNGRLIYETTVPPGSFVIDDLYPTGYGGNLDVAVTEADGSVQTFQVPYASVTQLLRPGMHRYDFVTGELNDSAVSFRPTLYQATYQRGLTNILSGYGGVQGSGADYYALQLGTAVSTPVGAFSADVTQARVHLKSTAKTANSGQSYQLSYSKYLPDTDSNLTIAAYRFSTSGYYDYLTAMRAIDQERRGGTTAILRPKNRFNVTMNQGLPAGWGQVYLTGYTQNYWSHANSDLQYQMGYSNSLGRVNFNLSAGRVRNTRGKMENNWLFNMSLPLGDYRQKHVPMLTSGLNRNSNGRMGGQVGVSGTYGDDYQYNYGMTATSYNQNVGSSVSLNGGWRSPYTNLTGNYGTGKHYQNMSVGASGTVIAWPGGVVATPYTGDTFAVVEARNAKGAKVGGYPGIRIDGFGHAAIPYLNPYEMNEITLDPKGLPQEVELDNTSEKVAPYSGAVSKVVFKTRKGIPLLITTRQRNGEPVPFGAEVFDDADVNVGSVGQMGQAYARVEKENGQLIVRWGSGVEQQCSLTYRVSGEGSKGFRRLNAICE
jgi:outer membrane usher protein